MMHCNLSSSLCLSVSLSLYLSPSHTHIRHLIQRRGKSSMLALERRGFLFERILDWMLYEAISPAYWRIMIRDQAAVNVAEKRSQKSQWPVSLCGAGVAHTRVCMFIWFHVHVTYNISHTRAGDTSWGGHPYSKSRLFQPFIITVSVSLCFVVLEFKRQNLQEWNHGGCGRAHKSRTRGLCHGARSISKPQRCVFFWHFGFFWNQLCSCFPRVSTPSPRSFSLLVLSSDLEPPEVHEIPNSSILLHLYLWCVCVCLWVHVCAFVCVCVCMYVYVCVCVYM